MLAVKGGKHPLTGTAWTMAEGTFGASGRSNGGRRPDEPLSRPAPPGASPTIGPAAGGPSLGGPSVGRLTPETGVRSGQGAPAPRSDLADHFLACCKLGRYLTVMGGARFVITDDFRQQGISIEPAAAALASIYSRDFLVAQAALLPLGRIADTTRFKDRERFERLFSLIEANALSPDVQGSAKAMVEAGFREAEIREIEADLGHRLNPARIAYREFLAVIGQLMQGRVSASDFLQEFLAFTRAVAGKLDFGIYSFCIDRIFGNTRVPLNIKQLLATEIMKYPPMVRREMLTNILTLPGQSPELAGFIRQLCNSQLDSAQIIEIELLEAVKASRVSMNEIEQRLRSAVPAA